MNKPSLSPSMYFHILFYETIHYIVKRIIQFGITYVHTSTIFLFINQCNSSIPDKGGCLILECSHEVAALHSSPSLQNKDPGGGLDPHLGMEMGGFRDQGVEKVGLCICKVGGVGSGSNLARWILCSAVRTISRCRNCSFHAKKLAS